MPGEATLLINYNSIRAIWTCNNNLPHSNRRNGSPTSSLLGPGVLLAFHECLYMYDQYFGFSESPFSITPDPRFFYTNPVYLEAYANLRYGIEAKKGFIAITGEVGTGKTTLLRKLMLELRNSINWAFIVNTDLTFDELLQVILYELDLPTQEKDRVAMVTELNAYLIEQLKKGRIVCLLIDEAQNLSDHSLEGLRLLSNLETAKEKLLQIVLMGQPELSAKLDQPNLRQFKQRIATRCEIAPLKEEEVSSYINFRLGAAGYQKNNLFHPDAIQKIAFYSKGIPRLINVICDNALLIAYAASQKTVSAHRITEVARDLRLGMTVERPEANEKETLRISPVEAQYEVPVLQAPSRADRNALRTAVSAAIGTCITILLFLTLNSAVNLQSLFTSSRQPDVKHQLRKEVLPVTQPEPQKANAETDDGEFQKPDTEFNRKGNRITIHAGSTVHQIAIDAYGANAILGMDLIKDFNPQITNINWVFAGEELMVPVIRPETLIRSQHGGSYSLVIGSFLTRTEAEESARRLDKGGYQGTITQKRVSNDLSLHRLEINGFKTVDEATQMFDVALKNQWLSFAGQPENRKPSVRRALSGSNAGSRQR